MGSQKNSTRMKTMHRQTQNRRKSLVLFFVLVLTCLLKFAEWAYGADDSEESSYYDILGLQQDATMPDIKKAYRRLALLHHPDRNKGREEDSTKMFRTISEAYRVLSDDTFRREYDRSLLDGERGRHRTEYGMGPYRDHRDASVIWLWEDPFVQFERLFRNDPFFSSHFKEMDDSFSTTFQKIHVDGNGEDVKNGKKKKVAWRKWVADKLGLSVSIPLPKSAQRGKQSTKTHSKRFPSVSTYTSRSTRTTIENGRSVTIQVIEKDGNRIEEKYVGDDLVERKINGVIDYSCEIDE